MIDQKSVDSLRKKIKKEIDEGLAIAFEETHPQASTENELNDVYASFVQNIIEPTSEVKSEKRFIDAISDGLRQSMERHSNLVLMGQDIADYGGVFKITEGFVKQFGKDRVRNTPLCEAAIVGSSLGLSIKGMKAMVEMQFADFVTEGFNQIVNNLARHIGAGDNRQMWWCACQQVQARLLVLSIRKATKRGFFILRG